MGIAKRVHAVKVFFGAHPSGLATGPVDLNPPLLNPVLDEGNVVVPENLGKSETRIRENSVAASGLTPIKAPKATGPESAGAKHPSLVSNVLADRSYTVLFTPVSRLLFRDARGLCYRATVKGSITLSIQRDWDSTIASVGLGVGIGWVSGLCFVLLLWAAPKTLYRFREPNSSAFCSGIQIGTPLQDVLSRVDGYVPPLHEEVYRHSLDVAWHKGRCEVELDPANDRVIKVNLLDGNDVKWDPPVK